MGRRRILYWTALGFLFVVVLTTFNNALLVVGLELSAPFTPLD